MANNPALLLGKIKGGRVTIDILWLFWVMVSFLIFGYLTTYVDLDQSLAFKGLIGFSLLIGSTLLTGMMVGFNADTFFSLKEITESLFLVMVAIVAITVVNSVTPTVFSATPITGALFAMLIGISEESMFRGFLQSTFSNMVNDEMIAIIMSSAIGTIYHSAVYGLSNGLFVIVFFSFSVVGVVFMLSNRRLSVVFSAHALVNLMSWR